MSYRNPVRAVGVVGTVTTVSSGSGGGTTPGVTPTLRGSSATRMAGATAVSNTFVNAPAETVAGDLLVLFLEGFNVDAGTPTVTPAGSGWTTITTVSDTNNTWSFAAWKVAGAGEAGGGSFQITFDRRVSDMTHITLAVKDATTLTKIGTTGYFSNSSGQANTTLPTGTTMGGSGLGLAWSREASASDQNGNYISGELAWGTTPPGAAAWAVAKSYVASQNYSGMQKTWTVPVTWPAGTSYNIACTASQYRRPAFDLLWIK